MKKSDEKIVKKYLKNMASKGAFSSEIICENTYYITSSLIKSDMSISKFNELAMEVL